MEAHVANCADCREGVSELQLIDRAIRKGAPTPLVPEADVERLNRLIDADERSERRGRFGLAAAATLLVALAAGVFLLSLQADRPSPQFETATSSAGGSPMDYVVLVELAPDLAPIERQEAFDSIGLREASETQEVGVYRGVLSLTASSVSELESIQTRLAERERIRSVRVVALQLPVKPNR